MVYASCMHRVVYAWCQHRLRPHTVHARVARGQRAFISTSEAFKAASWATDAMTMG